MSANPFDISNYRRASMVEEILPDPAYDTIKLVADNMDIIRLSAAVAGGVLSGEGPPASTLGLNGSLYFDKTDPENPIFYGPKTAEGGWGEGYTIRAPALRIQFEEFNLTEETAVFEFDIPAVPNFIWVSLNGIQLPKTDFTHVGRVVTLLVPAQIGDHVAIQGFASAVINDALTTSYGDRTVADKLTEVLSAKDFGAKGDGTSNDTAALDRAFTVAIEEGRQLRLPAGVYRLTEPLDFTIPALATFGTGQHFSLIGDGSGSTVINWQGGVDETAIRLVGNMPGTDRLKIAGFRIVRPDMYGGGLQDKLGAGLKLERCIGVKIEDFLAFRQARGIHLIGCLIVSIQDSMLMYNDIGLLAETGGYASTPNAIVASRVNFGSSWSRGAVIRQGSANTFTDCQFEGTGEGVNNASIAAELVNLGAAGSVGASFERCYFEGNEGSNIFWFQDSDATAGVTVNALYCNFNRFVGQQGPSIVADHNARTASHTGMSMLDITGSTFSGYGAYVEDATKPYLTLGVAGGYDKLKLVGRARTLMQNAGEVGTIPAGVTEV